MTAVHCTTAPRSAVPTPREAAEFLAQKNGITYAELAHDLEGNAHPMSPAVCQAALELAREESALITTGDFRARAAAAYYQTRRARFLSSAKRRRKPCKVCARLGRKCARHTKKGGAA